jgi:hypothetical protein
MTAHNYNAIGPYGLMACIITNMDFIVYPYSGVIIIPSGISINALVTKELRVEETAGMLLGVYPLLGWSR